MDFAIKVDGLSKCFQVYGQPHDRIKQAFFGRINRLIRRPSKSYFREFWALKGASFTVAKGDTVGIIGRNGSGKSTLLQLICGTLEPTSGSVQVKGRVAALLELGAGFNPEFTGRENVFLSAAILGLTAEEVDQRMTSILNFADIGDFIDQPVKVYSSGMYVRLAFAIIAHVDADIMIIDEALAVGDAVFVQKCMRFLRDFKTRGTLLFVSHDSGAVLTFCQSAIWLDRGQLRMHSSAPETTQAYIEYCAQESYGDEVKLEALNKHRATTEKRTRTLSRDENLKVEIFENISTSDGWASGAASIVSVTLINEDQPGKNHFVGGERVRLDIEAIAHSELASPILGFFVKDGLGQSLFGEHTYTYQAEPLLTQPDERLSASFSFHMPLLPNGEYSMTVSIADGNPQVNTQHHWLHDAMIIRVSSPTLRYGLVGIPFEYVTMQKVDTVD